MASLTSESDSTTFTSEENQRHLLCYFLSLSTDIDHVSQYYTRVPAGTRQGMRNGRGVRVRLFFFASGCLSISFRLQLMTTLKEGNQWQMWEFIRIV